MKTIRVRAIHTGFAAGHFRACGDEFDCPLNQLALTTDDPEFGWMAPLEAVPKGVESAHLKAVREGVKLPPWGQLVKPKMIPTPFRPEGD